MIVWLIMHMSFLVWPVTVLLVHLLFSACSAPHGLFLISPILPFPTLCLVFVGLCPWRKACFPLGGLSFWEKLGCERSCWPQQVASCLGRCLSCLTYQFGRSKGSSPVASASLLPFGGLGGDLSKAFQADLPRILWPAGSSVPPGHQVHAPSASVDFSVIQWYWNI